MVSVSRNNVLDFTLEDRDLDLDVYVLPKSACASKATRPTQSETISTTVYSHSKHVHDLKANIMSSDSHGGFQESQELKKGFPMNPRTTKLHFGNIEEEVTSGPFDTETDSRDVLMERNSEVIDSRFVFGDFPSESSQLLTRTESGSWKRKSVQPFNKVSQDSITDNFKKRRFQNSSKPGISKEKKENQETRPTNLDKELDDRRLFQRQKQLDFGKNTLGYDEYLRQVPKNLRKPEHPRTPDKFRKMSKRQWDIQVRRWRRRLHQYDPQASQDSTTTDIEHPTLTEGDDLLDLTLSSDEELSRLLDEEDVPVTLTHLPPTREEDQDHLDIFKDYDIDTLLDTH